MSSSLLNKVYKTGILAIEESAVTTVALSAGDSTVAVSGYYMTDTPFIVGQSYILRDNSFKSSDATAAPNTERVLLTHLGADCTAALNADGIGYHYTGSLTVAGYDATLGFSGGIKNDYTSTNVPTILTPGKEIAIQSTDFNCRFKTASDVAKTDMDDEASRYLSGDYGRDLSIAGLSSGEVTFTSKLSWAGAVSTVPNWAKLMRSMGHLVRKWTTAGVEFIASPCATETATIWIINPETGCNGSGTVYRYSGMTGGNASSISAGKVGDPYMLTAKYMGSYNGTTELAASTIRKATAMETSVPECLISNVVTAPARVAGVTTTKTLEITQFGLDFGATVNLIYDQATASGISFSAITDSDPKLTLNPVLSRKSLDDIDYIVRNMVTGKITLVGAHMTIEVPNAQLLSPAFADREGFISTSRTYRCLRNDIGGGRVDTALPEYAMYSILIGARA